MSAVTSHSAQVSQSRPFYDRRACWGQSTRSHHTPVIAKWAQNTQSRGARRLARGHAGESCSGASATRTAEPRRPLAHPRTRLPSGQAPTIPAAVAVTTGGRVDSASVLVRRSSLDWGRPQCARSSADAHRTGRRGQPHPRTGAGRGAIRASAAAVRAQPTRTVVAKRPRDSLSQGGVVRLRQAYQSHAGPRSVT